uniref:Uncharacterized protein n=1 Tax=Piliocolobus tephrosceles TaxID=591936 RepID=A0A8C9IV64_9PRIM
MTMEASFRALDAFISPSAAITYGQVKGEAELEKTTCCTGSFTSLISTRSTFIPQASVLMYNAFSTELWKKQHYTGNPKSSILVLALPL